MSYGDLGVSPDGDASTAFAPSQPADPPQPAASQVVIVNPAENQSTLAFSVDGQSYSLTAGNSQRLDATPGMTIEFDRGLAGDTARYSLTAGTYTFKFAEKGWDLISDSPSASPVAGLAANLSQSGSSLSTPQN